jgi:glycosyltransferase involved in cell wall biosynthesis
MLEISVVIPVYNAAEYLSESVASALAQPEVMEVILVDDGSKDSSLTVAKVLAKSNSKVKVFTHPDGGNHGSAVARNIGIKAASYPYIAFIDADDTFLPNRFKLTKNIIETNPEIDGVYEAIENVFEEVAVSHSKQYTLAGVRKLHMVRKLVPPEDLLELLLTDKLGIILLQGLCVKRSVFDKVGYFTPEFREGQDMLMIKQIAAGARLLPGDLYNPVSFRRIHTTNITFSEFKDRSPTMYKEGEVLFKWGYAYGLSKKKKELLFKHYYEHFLYRKGVGYSKLKARYAFLFKVLIETPRVITFRSFWQLVPLIGRFIQRN